MPEDAEAEGVGGTDEPPDGEDDGPGDSDAVAVVGEAVTEIADGLGLD